MQAINKKSSSLSNYVERFFLTNVRIDVNIFVEFKFIKIKSKNFFRKNQKNQLNKSEVVVNVCLNLLKLVFYMCQL